MPELANKNRGPLRRLATTLRARVAECNARVEQLTNEQLDSSHAYYTWVARGRARAQQAGKIARYPAQRSVQRFLKGWDEVREAACHRDLSPRQYDGNE